MSLEEEFNEIEDTQDASENEENKEGLYISDYVNSNVPLEIETGNYLQGLLESQDLPVNTTKVKVVLEYFTDDGDDADESMVMEALILPEERIEIFKNLCKLIERNIQSQAIDYEEVQKVRNYFGKNQVNFEDGIFENVSDSTISYLFRMQTLIDGVRCLADENEDEIISSLEELVEFAIKTNNSELYNDLFRLGKKIVQQTTWNVMTKSNPSLPTPKKPSSVIVPNADVQEEDESA